jgi:hypothetical protein
MSTGVIGEITHHIKDGDAYNSSGGIRIEYVMLVDQAARPGF